MLSAPLIFNFIHCWDSIDPNSQKGSQKSKCSFVRKISKREKDIWEKLPPVVFHQKHHALLHSSTIYGSFRPPATKPPATAKLTRAPQIAKDAPIIIVVIPTATVDTVRPSLKVTETKGSSCSAGGATLNITRTEPRTKVTGTRANW